MDENPAHLSALWIASLTGDTKASGWALRRHDLGSLLLPTGRVVACDAKLHK